MTRISKVQTRIKCPLENQCRTVAPGSLTTPRGTGNDPHDEVKQFPVSSCLVPTGNLSPGADGLGFG